MTSAPLRDSRELRSAERQNAAPIRASSEGSTTRDEGSVLSRAFGSAIDRNVRPCVMIDAVLPAYRKCAVAMRAGAAGADGRRVAGPRWREERLGAAADSRSVFHAGPTRGGEHRINGPAGRRPLAGPRAARSGADQRSRLRAAFAALDSSMCQTHGVATQFCGSGTLPVRGAQHGSDVVEIGGVASRGIDSNTYCSMCNLLVR